MADEERIDEEKIKWKLGIDITLPPKVWVEREIERIGRLKRSAENPRRFSFLRKKNQKLEGSSYQELRNEFRTFLTGIRDNIELYLWYALSGIAGQGGDRKLEAAIFRVFGTVTATFSIIYSNFDPASVTPDLLAFLKDRITKLSASAFSVMGFASSLGASGDPLTKSVEDLEKLLNEVGNEMRKYYKRDEAFEAAATDYMKNK